MYILGSWMVICLGNYCVFGLSQVPFINLCQFMYPAISPLLLREECGSDCLSFWSLPFVLLYVHHKKRFMTFVICNVGSTLSYFNEVKFQNHHHSLSLKFWCSVSLWKKVNRRVHGMQQSQTVANPKKEREKKYYFLLQKTGGKNAKMEL